MRREKGVNKSHTGLHLLLENSKQKQAFSPRTKGSFLPGCSFSILLFSLQSGGKRGSRHLSSSLQRGRSSKQGCFSLGAPNFWGCVAEVTPSSEGEQPQAWSPLKEGNSASLTIYRAFKQLLCVSPSLWQFQESLRSPPNPTGMQGCFMSHSSSTPFSTGGLTCRELSASPTASKDKGIQWPQEAPEPFLTPPAGPNLAELGWEGKAPLGTGVLLSARQEPGKAQPGKGSSWT